MTSIVELADAELDQVTGGCVPVCPAVLVTPHGPVFQANSPNTPAADHGLELPKSNGAYVGAVCL
jgi:hypothetical protein